MPGLCFSLLEAAHNYGIPASLPATLSPLFYNVLKDSVGRIYAGTTAGIFRMEGPYYHKIDERAGNLALDRQGGLAIDFN